MKCALMLLSVYDMSIVPNERTHQQPFQHCSLLVTLLPQNVCYHVQVQVQSDLNDNVQMRATNPSKRVLCWCFSRSM